MFNIAIGNAAAAIMFLAAATNAMDVYSATNSSPWTAFKFANDADAVQAMWRYVRHAIAVTFITNAIASLIAQSWWPIFGALIAGAYMFYLYWDAVKRGRAKGTTSWEAK